MRRPQQRSSATCRSWRLFNRRRFALVDSGNGIQAAWKLRPAVVLGVPTRNGKNGKWIFPAEDQPKVELAEAISKALMESLGSAAGTQNIDRVLRLPGTINLPNEVKRNAGRVRCEASLIRITDEATVTFADFPKVTVTATAKPKAGGKKERKKGELPSELKNMLYLTGSKPIGPYESRSELLWAFIKIALRKGIDENDIIAATLDQTYSAGGLFQHVDEKGGEDYIKTQIEKATNDDDLPKGEKRLIRLHDWSTRHTMASDRGGVARGKMPGVRAWG